MIGGRLAVPADFAYQVDEETFARLLGYPSGRLPDGPVAEATAASRRTFAERCEPWAYASTVEVQTSGSATVEVIGGPSFSSAVLHDRLLSTEADRLVVAAVSAGAEVDRLSAAEWERERPLEAYCLDRLGAAIAVNLGRWLSQALKELLADTTDALLPGYSPGYEGWPLEQQHSLATCLEAPPLRVHASGMMEPKNTLLAAFGVAAHSATATSLWDEHSCSWCSLAGCGLRRSAYDTRRNTSEVPA